MSVCRIERTIEINRQLLCDRGDFEPYFAYQRVKRDVVQGITPENLMIFLQESLVDSSLAECRAVHQHYNLNENGVLSYKEFLEIVLPREHSDLRAFVTQRDCHDNQVEDHLSFETETALACLIKNEVMVYNQLKEIYLSLQERDISASIIIQEISGSKNGRINFDNLQRYLHNSGLLPYDYELISILRRLDRDDDAMVGLSELDFF